MAETEKQKEVGEANSWRAALESSAAESLPRSKQEQKKL
jgi:hypothetical protein